MCSSANIRCLIPDGFVKLNTESIDESKPDINHTWAVVQLGISPDEWFYVDPTWGSGNTDAEMKVFTRSFNDAYFFADKGIFNWQHYPDNEAWKLGPAPKNKGIFYSLPLVKEAAYGLGLKKFNPDKGKLKVKADKPSAFSFTLDPKTAISNVTLTTGEIKKQKTKEITFSYSNGLLSFNNKFEEGEYPLTITVNGKALMTYAIEAE
jgi:transglutaminase/protease-like cytokinesis protein 3